MRKESTLRPMTKHDWDDFQKLDCEVFPNDEMPEEHFKIWVERGGFFALDYEESMIGYLLLTVFGENEGHIMRIAVDPLQQHKGFGSRLLEHALNWSRQKKLHAVRLYTQDDNRAAQALYRKLGFVVSGTSWHHIVPLESIQPVGEYSCHLIQDQEIEAVGTKYSSLPSAQIRRFLDAGNLVVVLKNSESEIVGACRFTPSYPGCFPFEIDDVEALDDFIFGLKPYMLPEFDYIRITQTDNLDLASECELRGYKLHHRLLKMTRQLKSEEPR